MSVFSDVEHSIRGFAQRTLWPFLPAEEDRGEVSATQKPPLFSPLPVIKRREVFLRKEGRDTISESLFAAQNQALEIASRPSQKSSRVLLN